MKHVKGDSTTWINERGFARSRFAWQEGYGAFSYSMCDVPNVIKYILNQEIHHQKRTFMDEYLSLLQEFEIDYKDEYVFVDSL